MKQLTFARSSCGIWVPIHSWKHFRDSASQGPNAATSHSSFASAPASLPAGSAAQPHNVPSFLSHVCNRYTLGVWADCANTWRLSQAINHQRRLACRSSSGAHKLIDMSRNLEVYAAEMDPCVLSYCGPAEMDPCSRGGGQRLRRRWSQHRDGSRQEEACVASYMAAEDSELPLSSMSSRAAVDAAHLL